MPSTSSSFKNDLFSYYVNVWQQLTCETFLSPETVWQSIYQQLHAVISHQCFSEKMNS